ncbi:cleavage and polyadenylation specificity factor subunit 2-like [Cucumis melo]|uniref:Cleavage and polyadenylation specificity factor subunit 2 n=1 Tax=Cucumis melo TaxID=3656 RepID=A0ABM3L8U5_CUCME|nr:cleavage and polyadenylation specificity factor subunit 2-like [Cucumis melo]
MANFKQFLANKGIQVEFPRGALRCGEYFTLRKVTNASQKGGGSGTQQVVIEGPLCEDYYKISGSIVFTILFVIIEKPC